MPDGARALLLVSPRAGAAAEFAAPAANVAVTVCADLAAAVSRLRAATVPAVRPRLVVIECEPAADPGPLAELVAAATAVMVPVVALCGRAAQAGELYALGVAACVTSPADPAERCRALEATLAFWLEVNELPYLDE